jgi:hypothetical protein
MHAPVDQAHSPLTRYRAPMVLLCVSAPSFMLQLDANIVAVSLPSISQSLDANFAGTEWVVTAYTLSFASLLLPAGALAIGSDGSGCSLAAWFSSRRRRHGHPGRDGGRLAVWLRLNQRHRIGIGSSPAQIEFRRMLGAPSPLWERLHRRAKRVRDGSGVCLRGENPSSGTDFA